MKKLGKKIYDVIETVEAYDVCSGVASCGPGCSDWYVYVRNNDKVYTAMHNALA